jgi:hypothetical protein
MSGDVPSELVTSLNVLITGKDRARETRARCMPKNVYLVHYNKQQKRLLSISY